MQMMSFDLFLLSQSGSDCIFFTPLYAPGRYPPLRAGTVLPARSGKLRLIAASSESKNRPLGHPLVPPWAQAPVRSGRQEHDTKKGVTPVTFQAGQSSRDEE